PRAPVPGCESDPVLQQPASAGPGLRGPRGGALPRPGRAGRASAREQSRGSRGRQRAATGVRGHRRSAARGEAAREHRTGPRDRMNNGAITSVIVLSSLISTWMLGPAVSLNGSPTVSPITAALWAGDPLPP